MCRYTSQRRIQMHLTTVGSLLVYQPSILGFPFIYILFLPPPHTGLVLQTGSFRIELLRTTRNITIPKKKKRGCPLKILSICNVSLNGVYATLLRLRCLIGVQVCAIYVYVDTINVQFFFFVSFFKTFSSFLELGNRSIHY